MTVGFDTETDLIVPGRHAPPLVCVQLALSKTDYTLIHHSEARPIVEELLDGPELIVGFNVAYDMSVICAEWPDLIPKVFDKYWNDGITCTELREKIIHLARGHLRWLRLGGGEVKHLTYSLEEVAEFRLGVKLNKAWQEKFGGFRDVPVAFWPQEARKYALDDAVVPLALYESQEIDRDLLDDQFRSARAAFWLQLMSCWGMRVDMDALRAFEHKVRSEHGALKLELMAAGLVRRDGTRNVKAVQRRVIDAYRVKGSKTYPATKTGAKTDSDTCALSGDPVLAKYSDFSSLSKTINTDIKLLSRGLIQTRFEVIVETSRTSSSPNVQNWPTDEGMRECIVAPPGWVFAVSDYAAFELRTWSQLCFKFLGVSKMKDFLNGGGDPHCELASKMLHISYEQAVKEFEIDRKGRVYKPRQASKAANFGFPGGLGTKTFKEYARTNYGVDLELKDCEDIRQHWLTAWEESGLWLDHVATLVEGANPTILHPCSNRYRGDVSFTQAANGFFQTLAADAAKNAGFLLAQACYADPKSVLYGCRPFNFVHDEFVTLVPDDDRAAEAAEEQARVMVAGASPFLPDVPPVVETLLCRRWSKAAKPVRDATGKLVPWDFQKKGVAA